MRNETSFHSADQNFLLKHTIGIHPSDLFYPDPGGQERSRRAKLTHKLTSRKSCIFFWTSSSASSTCSISIWHFELRQFISEVKFSVDSLKYTTAVPLKNSYAKSSTTYFAASCKYSISSANPNKSGFVIDACWKKKPSADSLHNLTFQPVCLDKPQPRNAASS